MLNVAQAATSMLNAAQTATLGVHVLSGTIALLSGFGAIVTKKGSQRHVTAGRIYVVAMAVVVATAVALALAESNYFLFAIAVFSGYLVFTGYRALSRKRPVPGVAAPVDWIVHLTMVVFGVGMIVLGGSDVIAGDSPESVLVIFGGIGAALAGRELWAIHRPPGDQMAWLFRHVGFMGGGYIATVTAAITVNLTVLPPVARWLGPTIVGGSLIALANLRYRRKFEGRSTSVTPE